MGSFGKFWGVVGEFWRVVGSFEELLESFGEFWGVLVSFWGVSQNQKKTNFRTQGAETRNVQSSRLLQTVWVGWAVGGQTATDWHLPLKVQILTLKDADSHPSSLNLVDFEILSAGRRAA